MLKLCFGLLFGIGLIFLTPTAFAGKGKKYHCEKKENGKMVDLKKIKSKKSCKKKGGKWVRKHKAGHEHGKGHADGDGHGHDDEKKGSGKDGHDDGANGDGHKHDDHN